MKVQKCDPLKCNCLFPLPEIGHTNIIYHMLKNELV